MRRLLAREDGVALPVALTALALVSMLAAMTASGAVSLGDSSTDDRNSKRALAAAEAGLNVAAYRVNYYTNTNPPLSLSNLAILNNKCITTLPVDPDGAGECQSVTEDLGNNARYTYYVTPNPPPGGCPTEIPDQGPPPPSGTGTRCVTSIGEANGVRRRVQTRLRSALVPIFSFQGMVGTGGIKINNGVVLNSMVGSNGTVTVNGTGKVGDIYLAPTGTVDKSQFATTGTVYPHEPFVLPKLDAEFANSLLQPPNTNYTLPGTTTGTVTWNPATRDLVLNPSATITLSSGTYNLCRLKMAKDAKLYVASGATVKLFIDSQDRDPTCATAATGGPTLELASGTQVNNPGEPKNLQIYLYGRNDGSEALTLANGVAFRGSIYAPQTSLKFASELDVAGGVVARFLEFSKSVNFTWDVALKEILTATRTYERKGWSECPREPSTAGDPESGC